MVLGSGQPVSSDTILAASVGEPVNSTIQRASTQGPPEPESACVALVFSKKGSLTKWQAPQRGSTRGVYESKWSIFTRAVGVLFSPMLSRWEVGRVGGGKKLAVRCRKLILGRDIG